MAFWGGDTLERQLRGNSIIEPFCERQIDCAAYTLRMGSEAYITPDSKVGSVRRASQKLLKSKKITYLSEREQFIVPAGQFAWLLTKEHLNIPNEVIAFISLKTKYKFKGLINVSGFHVDPGFKGKLVYAVYNAGPQEIRLSEGQDLFLIWFADLVGKSEKPNRDYRDKLPQERIHEDFLVPGEILSLQSLQRELGRLDHRLTRIMAYGGAALAVGALLLVPVLRGPIIEWVSELFGQTTLQSGVPSQSPALPQSDVGDVLSPPRD